MRQCVLIGRANVGKTAFAIRFAAYLGVRRLEITLQDPDGQSRVRLWSPEEAWGALCGPEPHQTRGLQSIAVDLPMGKGRKRFALVDTSGLTDGIHPDPSLRRAMAQSLTAVRGADVILHLLDAAAVGERGAVAGIGEVDYQVAQFAQMRGGYLLLANKMDLPAAARGLAQIQREFVGHPIVPISALRGDGFDEVKRLVWRWL